MVAFQFSDRFFQRGQTWWECLESWQHERADFLNQVKRDSTLESFGDCLRQCDRDVRLAVVYSQHLRDSRMALPAIGNTISRNEAFQARFFWTDVYFPAFHTLIRRPAFRILRLDGEGAVSASWGPRPAAISQELQALPLHSPAARDQWLTNYDERRYLQALDRFLTGFLGTGA